MSVITSRSGLTSVVLGLLTALPHKNPSIPRLVRRLQKLSEDANASAFINAFALEISRGQLRPNLGNGNIDERKLARFAAFVADFLIENWPDNSRIEMAKAWFNCSEYLKVQVLNQDWEDLRECLGMERQRVHSKRARRLRTSVEARPSIEAEVQRIKNISGLTDKERWLLVDSVVKGR